MLFAGARRRIRCFRWSHLAASLVLLFGSGCEGVHLYDRARADVTAATKQKYADADILGSIEVQKGNLNVLLAEELKVVRDNHRLQVDFTLLELADNDSPMAATLTGEFRQSGLPSAPALREFLIALEDVTVRDAQIDGLRDRITRSAGVPPPLCAKDVDLPATWSPPEGLPDRTIRTIEARYRNYRAACEEKKRASNATKFSIARQTWQRARTDLQAADQRIEEARRSVAEKAKAYSDAVAAAKSAGKTGDEFRAAVRDKADALAGVLQGLGGAAPEVVSSERLASIVTLLQAAAGEETKVEDDPDLARATVVAAGLSSLSGDIAGLIAESKAPSVSNLLIALQHETVLLEHVKARRTLQQRRVDILEAKYQGSLKEARHMLDFHDAMCNFAVRAAGRPHPGTACDAFTVEVTKEANAPGGSRTECRIKGEPIPDCALAKPWKDYLNSTPSDAARREFYKALAALTQVFPLRSSQIEQDFHLIDLKHRENLANREMALRAWNNLAAVPIDQLDAYHQAGLKPETIADFIVKALGFTAITVGVSQ